MSISWPSQNFANGQKDTGLFNSAHVYNSKRKIIMKMLECIKSKFVILLKLGCCDDDGPG